MNSQGNSDEFWSIPVIWQEWGICRILKAKHPTIEEAKEAVFATETPLPQGEYIDDSLQIDEEGIEIHNEG